MPETNTAPAARGLARLFIRKSVEQMHAGTPPARSNAVSAR